MKYLITIKICFLVLLANPQNKYFGEYSGYNGNIIIDSNYCFKYSVQINCFQGTFIIGKWTQKNDTIYFTKTVLFDTIRTELDNQSYIDSLVVSNNGRIETIKKENYIKYLEESAWESQFLHNAEKLFYKKEKLYEIKPNGKLNTKKLRRQFNKPTSLGMYFYLLKQKKKFDPWYTKLKS